jgi:muramoyltetrapeptide carboxypeptidase LdcA involved in peptidoglycan recycling
VTSLHLAILKRARLRTFYGPALMAGMGEWPAGVPETSASFLEAVQTHRAGGGTRQVRAFDRWSHHFRSWANGDWQTVPRQWLPNPGWRVLVPGEATGPVLAVNLNTLVASAGTPEWPELKGRLLLIEEMFCPMSRFERSLRQLDRIGVWDEIAGLLVGKPEKPDAEGAPFDRDALLLEVLGARAGRFPVVTEVDVSHTVPMHTIPQEVQATLRAKESGRGLKSPELELLEPGVE